MSGLDQIIDQFRGRRLMVIGDLILDRFVWGSVSRISPEAPVPIVEVERISDHAGGAANVAANLASLGASVFPLGVVGDDRAGQLLCQKMEDAGIATTGLLTASGRSTSLKSRVVARHQQVCRTDRETRTPLSGETVSRLLEVATASLGDVEGVIFSDYAKGVVEPRISTEIIRMARGKGKFVAVDPKGRDFTKYAGASVITPNQLEFEQAAGLDLRPGSADSEAARELIERTSIQALLVTRGELGMHLYEPLQTSSIKTAAREVFDVTGAGDTVISVFTLSHVSGASLYESAVLANLAAGLVIAKLGTASVSRKELVDEVRRVEASGAREAADTGA